MTGRLDVPLPSIYACGKDILQSLDVTAGLIVVFAEIEEQMAVANLKMLIRAEANVRRCVLQDKTAGTSI